MAVHLISYATPDYRPNQRRLERSAVHHGVDVIHSYGPRQLKGTSFYARNHVTLRAAVGGGYWLWKPWIIGTTLDRLGNDDILLYADSGSAVVSDLAPLLATMDPAIGLSVFAVGAEGEPGGVYPNRMYTKRDCFLYMEADKITYHDACQVTGSCQVYRKTDFSLDLVSEWLRHCEDPRKLTDQENVGGLPNLDGFVAHRHDQSILSILSHRHRLLPLPDPSQFGDHLRTAGGCPTVFDLHRTRPDTSWIPRRAYRRLKTGLSATRAGKRQEPGP